MKKEKPSSDIELTILKLLSTTIYEPRNEVAFCIFFSYSFMSMI
jgi:hypothetical protein